MKPVKKITAMGFAALGLWSVAAGVVTSSDGDPANFKSVKVWEMAPSNPC